MQYSSALVMALASAASAATIKVNVSNLQASLSYFPNDIMANVGDDIEFDFFPKNRKYSALHSTSFTHRLTYL